MSQHEYRCWLCGKYAPSGVCAGPHAEYQLRSLAGVPSRNVELPYWWPVAPAVDVTEGDPDEHRGVTTSGLRWHIRYDPAERLRLQEEAERAARRETAEMDERRRDLEQLLALAKRYGYALRPLAINVAVLR